MGAQQIKTWSLMKQALRTKFEVENHGGQRQGQANEEFMESSMGEKPTKANELSQAQDVLDRKSFTMRRRTLVPLIQPQSLDFLTTICGTNSNHGMKAKGEGMGKELGIGYEDTSISLSLNPFLLCHEFSFKELKLFLELNASYMTLIGNLRVNLVTCEQALDVAHMFKFSSPCAYLEKQLLDSVSRIKLSYHDLELLHYNFFFDHIVATFSSSCASICSKIHIFLESFFESGYDERISWFSWTLSDVFHVKLKGEFVEKYDYESSFFVLL
ncbi:hypothetical protein M9H77_07318 [Catharanthus roseus]|uniref:Uncharacterized protein n=1 Tax=Catharanthus roseus TaxID=4058 RepID=A0ACC0BUV7_CATRO|nr:hypothetical protein M9H77_07318 [Catharanthus roseus]